MDEYSQAYKDFMRGAEALQALWVPGAGDRYTFLGADKAYLLDYPLDPRLGGVDDDVRWLPSLFQLIGIIESAGYRLKLDTFSRTDMEGLRYDLVASNFQTEDHIEAIESDLMLCAAQLAARAVEGK